MKAFQSVFKDELTQYLEISRGTVSEETLRNTRRVLLSFDSMLAEENMDVISEAAVNRWIKVIHQVNAPKTVSDKVSYLRKFLRYLQFKGHSVFMPDCPKHQTAMYHTSFQTRKSRHFWLAPTIGLKDIQTLKPVRRTWSFVCCCGCFLAAGSGWVNRLLPK